MVPNRVDWRFRSDVKEWGMRRWENRGYGDRGRRREKKREGWGALFSDGGRCGSAGKGC